jgi:hypothetical protein
MKKVKFCSALQAKVYLLRFATAIFNPMKVQLVRSFLLLWGLTNSALAQNSSVAAGVKATGSGGSVSYSVGPIIFKKPDGSLASSGIQQPYEIYSLGTETVSGAAVQLSFYPNPTTHFLHLVLETTTDAVYEYQVATLDGKKVLASQKINATNTLVDLANAPAGIYLLTVTLQQQNIKTFKIIKH